METEGNKEIRKEGRGLKNQSSDKYLRRATHQRRVERGAVHSNARIGSLVGGGGCRRGIRRVGGRGRC